MGKIHSTQTLRPPKVTANLKLILRNHTKKIRNTSEQCGKHTDIKNIKRFNKSVVLKKDEKVLVRLRPNGGKRAPKRRFVVQGKVIKKVKELETIKYH